jgi:hypothetical protein
LYIYLSKQIKNKQQTKGDKMKLIEEYKFKIAMLLFRIYWKIGYVLFDEIRDIEMDYFKFYNTNR